MDDRTERGQSRYAGGTRAADFKAGDVARKERVRRLAKVPRAGTRKGSLLTSPDGGVNTDGQAIFPRKGALTGGEGGVKGRVFQFQISKIP